MKSVIDRRWGVFTLLAIAQFVVILDISVVNIALPSMQAPLGFTQDGLQWVVDAYMLTFGGFLLLGGRAADLFGRKRIFLAGLTLFGLASFACGMSDTSTQLIAARAAQGLGGALMSPAALSLVVVTFPEDRERNRAMGLWGAVAAAGGATGVVLGGVITDALGWEWVFWINVPLTLGAALVGVRLLTETERTGDVRHFDALGAITVTAGLSALIYGFVRIGEHGWDGRAGIALAAAAVLLTVFVITELNVPEPVVDFSIFKVRGLTAANVIMLMFSAGAVAMTFFVTIYVQRVLNYGPIAAGLCFLPIAVGQVITSQVVVGRLMGRMHIFTVLVIGLGLTAASFLWFAQLSTDGSFLKSILGPGLLLAVGSGFAFTALVVSSVSGVEPERSGIAGGMINMCQQIGGALGLAILASVATWRTNRIADGPVDDSALTAGFRLGFLVAAALIALGAVVGWLATRTRPATAGSAAGSSAAAQSAPVREVIEPSLDEPHATGATS
ncbi:MFS transporter [Streptomyces sp. R35]|uniref:MFS transporter n=1 Tax=Streptomyces sp. R35 TaxID=3238630 RepID=A0AB39SI13_9ACTN